MIADIRKAFQYFKNNFPIKKSTKGWYSFDCVFCMDNVGSRKMSVNFNHEVVKCWKCEYKHHILQFVMDLEGVRYNRAKEIIQQCKPGDFALDVLEDLPNTVSFSEVNLPVGYKPLLDGDTTFGKRARNYLKERDYNLEDLDMRGFGYCTKHDEEYDMDFFGRIIIPFKKNGKLVYYIGRTFIGDDLRYKNPPTDVFGVGKGDLIYNEDALNIYDEVMVTEGWADAITLGSNGISTQGWSISSTQMSNMLKSSCKRFVFVPDKEFYEQAVKTAVDFLDHKEVWVVNTDLILPDYPEKKDANELGKDLIMEQFNKTERLTFSSAMDIIM